jgi:hypothetical protein
MNSAGWDIGERIVLLTTTAAAVVADCGAGRTMEIINYPSLLPLLPPPKAHGSELLTDIHRMSQ